MEKARVKENKTRWGSSLFLSLDASLCSARVSSFSREVVFPPRQSVCLLYSSVLHFSPVVFPQLFFFSLINLGFLSLFRHFWIRFQKRHSFGLLPNTPLQRERERERGRHEDSLENAVRRALETFSGALFSFVAFDHPLGLVFSKWISFVSSLLLIRFFQSESKTTV